MRVLMTADPVGGVWTYAVELCARLGAAGLDVALATMGPPLRPEQREEARALPRVRLFESGYRLEWMDDPWDDVARSGDWLLEIAGRFRPDVVHLNQFSHGALDWDAPVLVVGHSCVLSWWEAVKGEPAPPSWDRYRREVARGLRAADLVVAPTGTMLDALEAHYGPLPPARVFPNGRAAARFTPRFKEPFVLSVGRLWDEAKNVAALARAARWIAWPVLLAGEAERPGSGGRVDLDGTRSLGAVAPDELAGWYGRASIFALPARYEPFGLSALEAALAGCALVLGDIPSLRELWDGAAEFVPPDEPWALAAALPRLIEAPERRGALAARARRRALERTPAAMADAYLGAYRSLRAGREAAEVPEASRSCA